MTVTTRPRHAIEVRTHPDRQPDIFDFASRDIGATQGTTVCYGGAILAHFRPGTRWWDRAMEVTEELIARAMERVVRPDGSWDFQEFYEAFTAALQEDRCTPWDGEDVETGW